MGRREFKQLLGWMTERQQIYRRKEAGEQKPWTADWAMQRFKFCNVFRELDRTTRQIREWHRPFADHPNLPIALAMARLIGHYPTLEAVGFPRRFSEAHLAHILDARMERGETTFTGAYRVPGSPTGERAATFLSRILAVLHHDRSWVHLTLKATYEGLQEHRYIGPFLAYEIVTDLRHTRWLNEASDIMHWCSVGPGSTRGLNRLHGRPLLHRLSQETGRAEIIALVRPLRYELQGEDPMFRSLEPRDVEHSLCEYDKWVRVSKEGGKTRSRYPGEG